MHEAAPYWFNGQVALAFQLQDARLIGQVRAFLDWTLQNQGADGWIGPEPYVANATTPRLVWPRYLVLLGLIQYAEADTTQTQRIVDAMYRFVSLANTIWKTDQQGDPDMGFQYDYQYVRWEEVRVFAVRTQARGLTREAGSSSMLWSGFMTTPRKVCDLRALDRIRQEDLLLETMQLVRDQGFSWKDDWYTPATFPTEAVTTFTMQTLSGVATNDNAALKSEALAWRFTGNETDKDNTFERLDLVYGYHGRASGTFSADEHLAGLDPSRGTELCAVVEQIFSLATIYHTFGNNSVADRIERLAYNALPGGIMHDWLSHQYDQEVNQIWAQTMDPFPWGNNGPNSNVFGFEPNYPCCTVNHPQGYPKFWAHSFLLNQSGDTLIHALLGPATYAGTVGASNDVEVVVDTLYPFGTTLQYTVTAAKPFTFAIRVPGWAQNALSTISVNDGKAEALSVDSESLQSVQITGKTTTIKVSLNAPLEVEDRYNGAVAITRGALNYALEITYNTTTTPGLRSTQALADVEVLYPDAPAQYLTLTDPHFHDNTLLPTSEWRVAIDPSTIVVHDTSSSIAQMPYYAWAPGSSPVTMTALACQIAWNITSGTASAPPVSPNACDGPVFTAKLVPFASTKLRLGEIPTMRAT
ncbi:hypothetical protein H0H92_011483 [Tricholoma furcatifolium]|nr:hypothetical protein H0H92_011483 [Tricholoma furcatifolium]